MQVKTSKLTGAALDWAQGGPLLESSQVTRFSISFLERNIMAKKEIPLSFKPTGDFTAGQLKKLIKGVPDDYTVHVADVNYDDSYHEAAHTDITVDDKKKRLYLPGTSQLDLD